VKPFIHTTADSSHYDQAAEKYDQFNEDNSQVINQTIANILESHNVTSVLDMTCGTGSQVFFLAKKGYAVIGLDINEKMLAVAQRKAQKASLDIQFIEGDMRTSKIGKFDVVITMFNAVGHLTKDDFEKAMQNIRENLKDGGLYIFDINNLSYLLKDDNITKLTIDWQKVSNGTTIRDIQYSTITKDGILASYTTHYEQQGSAHPKVMESAQTLQVYTAQQLQDMLHRNGFIMISQTRIDGSPLNEEPSDCILTVAQKKI